eukprot:349715-Chlamydomonas_euryale.AAC.18
MPAGLFIANSFNRFVCCRCGHARQLFVDTWPHCIHSGSPSCPPCCNGHTGSPSCPPCCNGHTGSPSCPPCCNGPPMLRCQSAPDQAADSERGLFAVLQKMLRKWFKEVPLEDIKRGNVADLLCYGFWYRVSQMLRMSPAARSSLHAETKTDEATAGENCTCAPAARHLAATVRCTALLRVSAHPCASVHAGWTAPRPPRTRPAAESAGSPSRPCPRHALLPQSPAQLAEEFGPELPDQLVSEIEAAWGVSFGEGYNAGLPFMAHLWQDLRCNYRPMLFYIGIEALFALKHCLLLATGFRAAELGGFVYYSRGLPPAPARDGCSSPTPVLFLHGVGLGLLPYLPFVWRLATTAQPVLAVESNHLGMRWVDGLPEADDVVDAIVAILDAEKVDRVAVVRGARARAGMRMLVGRGQATGGPHDLHDCMWLECSVAPTTTALQLHRVWPLLREHVPCPPPASTCAHRATLPVLPFPPPLSLPAFAVQPQLRHFHVFAPGTAVPQPGAVPRAHRPCVLRHVQREAHLELRLPAAPQGHHHGHRRARHPPCGVGVPLLLLVAAQPVAGPAARPHARGAVRPRRAGACGRGHPHARGGVIRSRALPRPSLPCRVHQGHCVAGARGGPRGSHGNRASGLRVAV